MVRLFSYQKEKKLTCNQITELLNEVSEVKRSESTYRRYFEGFYDGMEYQYKKMFGECSERILCIGDLHIPFQLPITTFSSYSGKIDTLVIAGDSVDMQGISKFQKAYRLSPLQEIIGCRSYFIALINYLNPKKVIILYGNHEIRFQSYLANNIDTDIKELLPKTPIDLIVDDGFRRYDPVEKTNIFYEPIVNMFPDTEIINAHSWWYQYGKTVFCHPLAYNSGMLKTAENALQWFRNEGMVFTTLVMAHTHRIGNYVIGNTKIFETGCCCDVTKANYTDGKLVLSQKEGYLYLTHDKEDALSMFKQEILN